MLKKNRKSREYLFIDGYNIINSWEELKGFGIGQLEEARNKLIEIMVEYQHYSGIEIIIVFDAHLVKGNNGTEYNHKGLKVIYTKENETADHYIEKNLHEMGKVERVRVATSDWMEQQIILGRGGTRISARELEMEVFNEKKLIRRKRATENEKNDFMLGKLDENTLKILNDWKSKNE